MDWIPPTSDRLKFNVDGSARGKPGPTGVGGVLRDSTGQEGSEISFNPRSSNSFADKLAKMGSSLAGDFIEWGDI
ncbi:hypothetical protein Dsin_019635 [Dipteronia sinensis]|uniref:RNase H type-1 domain-containing protein n=1 Tax=Dipteronia sinensis TaxID=43782 RepID=A0AAE0E476_9ROSI|nr:hypothetical protein Dsin_019635 [Dipteronia sinensis]